MAHLVSEGLGNVVDDVDDKGAAAKNSSPHRRQHHHHHYHRNHHASNEDDDDKENSTAPCTQRKMDLITQSLIAENPPPRRPPHTSSPVASPSSSSLLLDEARRRRGCSRPTTPTSRGPGSTTTPQHHFQGPHQPLGLVEHANRGERKAKKRVKRTVTNVTTRRVSRERKAPAQPTAQSAESEAERGGGTSRVPLVPRDRATAPLTTAAAAAAVCIAHESNKAALPSRDEGTDMSLPHKGVLAGHELRKDSTSPSPTQPETHVGCPPKNDPVADDDMQRWTPERLCAPGCKARIEARKLTEQYRYLARSSCPLSASTRDARRRQINDAATSSLASALVPHASETREEEEDESYFLTRFKKPILAPVDVNTESGAAAEFDSAQQYAPSTDRLFSVDPTSRGSHSRGADALGSTTATRTSVASQHHHHNHQQQQHQQQKEEEPLDCRLRSRYSTSTLCVDASTGGSGSQRARMANVIAKIADAGGARSINDESTSGDGHHRHVEEGGRRRGPFEVSVCVKVFAPSHNLLPIATAAAAVARAEPVFVVSVPGKVDLHGTTCERIREHLLDRLHYLLPASASLEGQLQLLADDNAPAWLPYFLPPFRSSRVALLPDSRLGDYFDVDALGQARSVNMSSRRGDALHTVASTLTTVVLRWQAVDNAVVPPRQQHAVCRADSPKWSTVPSGMSRGDLCMNHCYADPMSCMTASTNTPQTSPPAQSTLSLSHVSQDGGFLRLTAPFGAPCSSGTTRERQRESARQQRLLDDDGREPARRQDAWHGEESDDEDEGESEDSVRVIRISPSPSPNSAQRAARRQHRESKENKENRKKNGNGLQTHSPPRLVDHLIERCEEANLLLPHHGGMGYMSTIPPPFAFSKRGSDDRTMVSSHRPRQQLPSSAAADHFPSSGDRYQ